MLRLDTRFIDEMVAHAREEAPNECCGIVAGKDGRAVKLFRARNAEASPYRYNVDPGDLFRIYRECEESGWQLPRDVWEKVSDFGFEIAVTNGVAAFSSDRGDSLAYFQATFPKK